MYFREEQNEVRHGLPEKRDLVYRYTVGKKENLSTFAQYFTLHVWLISVFLNRISRLSHFTMLQHTVLNIQNRLGGRRSNARVYPGSAPSMFNNSGIFQSARPEPKQEPCKKYMATAAASLQTYSQCIISLANADRASTVIN